MTTDTVSGKVTANGITFDFAEVKSGNQGGGPRGLKMSAEGVAGSVVSYSITPNPHANPDYNSNQTGFYKALAEHVAKDCKVTKKHPAFKEIAKGTMPPTIKGPAWTKMTKQAQETAVKNYNDTQKKAEAEKIAKDFAAGIVAYLAKYNGKCSYGSVSYTLKKA
jgi:hypothetical protein